LLAEEEHANKKQFKNSALLNIMLFAIGSRVILVENIQGGLVGDECIVVSSKFSQIKIRLISADYELTVYKSMIEALPQYNSS